MLEEYADNVQDLYLPELDRKLRKLVPVPVPSYRRQQQLQGGTAEGQKGEGGQKGEKDVRGREPGECVGREEDVAGKFNKQQLFIKS